MSSNERKIQALFAEAHEHLEHRRIPDATRAAGEALVMGEAEWGGNDVRLVSLLRLVAETVRERTFGVVDDRPIPYLMRAKAIAESVLPSDHTALGDVYRELGLALQDAERLEEARDVEAKAVEIFERAGRTDDMRFCLAALAEIMIDLDANQAIATCRRYVEVEARTEPCKLGHYLAVHMLGRCLLRAGSAAEAVAKLEEARALLLRAKNGATHPWMRDLEAEIGQARALIKGPQL